MTVILIDSCWHRWWDWDKLVVILRSSVDATYQCRKGLIVHQLKLIFSSIVWTENNTLVCCHIFKTWPVLIKLGCLEVRGEIITTVLCCIVYWKLCAVISTLRWALLTVLWVGFCLTGPISLCLDSFVFLFVFFFVLSWIVLHMCCIIVTRWGGSGKIEA